MSRSHSSSLLASLPAANVSCERKEVIRIWCTTPTTYDMLKISDLSKRRLLMFFSRRIRISTKIEKMKFFCLLLLIAFPSAESSLQGTCADASLSPSASRSRSLSSVQTTTQVGEGNIYMNINTLLEMREQEIANPNRSISLEDCRREPTWRGNNVDHKKCSRLTGWTTPRAFWFHAEADNQPLIAMWWKEMDQKMTDCIDFAFQEAKINGKGSNSVGESHLPLLEDAAGYSHKGRGDVITLQNMFTEQESYGIQSLYMCIKRVFPNGPPSLQEHISGNDSIEHGTKGVNADDSVVPFMTHALERYLPGVAASVFRVVKAGYGEGQNPPPTTSTARLLARARIYQYDLPSINT